MTIPFGRLAIGADQPCLLVAELSANHNGSLQRALSTIDAAKAAGADAIKLQTYTADTLTLDVDRPEFVVPSGGPWAGRRLHDLYREAHTPWEWHPMLFERAREIGLEVFSTPFDSTAVDLLESLDAPGYKIASFELTDDGLLVRVAATGKPVVMSTGMATEAEIAHAVEVLRSNGTRDLVLLHCTSAYPAPDESMALRAMRRLAALGGGPIGLSDHSEGIVAPIAAVALGAAMIEKHFTLARNEGGVDAHFSLEPAEFRALAKAVRRAELMLRNEVVGPGLAESGSVVFRRSLFVVEDLAEGDLITERHIRSIRPGHGLAPRHLDQLIGRRAARAAARGTPTSWDLIGSAPEATAR
ncbi:MAG: pseudaminic acid synthase [Gemmatimonadales bacterium]